LFYNYVSILKNIKLGILKLKCFQRSLKLIIGFGNNIMLKQFHFIVITTSAGDYDKMWPHSKQPPVDDHGGPSLKNTPQSIMASDMLAISSE